MRLTITTPLAVLVDADGIASIRAEDASGAFGILPGHDDFLTVLQPSVLSYRDRQGGLHHVALRGGVLTIGGGTLVQVATREAYAGDDLDTLEATLRHSVTEAHESELEARTEAARLQLTAIRHIQSYLQAGRQGHPREDLR